MGDLEATFMEKVKDDISMDRADILFAPHHGRKSGKVPKKWLDEMNPSMVVIGEAESSHLDYHAGRDTLTQNSCGDIVLECVRGAAHVFVRNDTYAVDFLDDRSRSDSHGLNYLGTLGV